MAPRSEARDAGVRKDERQQADDPWCRVSCERPVPQEERPEKGDEGGDNDDGDLDKCLAE